MREGPILGKFCSLSVSHPSHHIEGGFYLSMTYLGRFRGPVYLLQGRVRWPIACIMCHLSLALASLAAVKSFKLCKHFQAASVYPSTVKLSKPWRMTGCAATFSANRSFHAASFAFCSAMRGFMRSRDNKHALETDIKRHDCAARLAHSIEYLEAHPSLSQVMGSSCSTPAGGGLSRIVYSSQRHIASADLGCRSDEAL